jgi:hypothetical protein
MATALGFAGYRYAIIEHPISALSLDEAIALGTVAAPQVLALLRGEPPLPSGGTQESGR